MTVTSTAGSEKITINSSGAGGSGALTIGGSAASNPVPISDAQNEVNVKTSSLGVLVVAEYQQDAVTTVIKPTI